VGASSYVHASALDFAKFGLLYLPVASGTDLNSSPVRVGRVGPNTAQRRRRQADLFYSWQWVGNGDQYGHLWASGYEGQQVISVVRAPMRSSLRLGDRGRRTTRALRVASSRSSGSEPGDYVPS